MKRRTVLSSLGVLVGASTLSACAPLSNELQFNAAPALSLRGTGDLAVAIARADGKVAIIDTSQEKIIAEVPGLGDLSHASIVFSRDARFAFVFGRDGGLTRIDILEQKITHRVIQGGNSIGGAISQDGSLVAVSNYKPGGVKVFSSADLTQVADIPCGSKTVGLVDAPGQRFVFSLWDKNEIWIADFSKSPFEITRFEDIGRNPYDALITPNGRYYMAGLFGEDGMAQLDLWHLEKGVKRVLPNYGRGEEKLPVYKMPHLEGWAIASGRAFIPAVGRHEVLILDTRTWQEVGRIPVLGQPVFVMARPDGRQIWVNFAHPDNSHIQVFDSETLEPLEHLQPGLGVLHMEFSPRGESVWVSVRDKHQINQYDTESFQLKTQLSLPSPSGIFMTARAHMIGL
ncbi:cytochrome D1 domain-containing protein [Neptunomonas sp.]|uniref:cytochrome D1 domain-containing protein n=1 Tax=Neptunomonas sp. TaxID=1971898 RepID=UPI0025EC4DFE|nr:cytochrome D1 domain-containing protein [Neptunomonas sp.]